RIDDWHAEFADRLAHIGADFHRRGWVLGTSGNFSVVCSPDPLLMAITASGADKGALTREQILMVDERGGVVRGEGRASDELKLHLAAVRVKNAGSVLHTHSVWSTLVS